MIALSQLTPAMDADTITALAARFVKLSRSALKPKVPKKPKTSEQLASTTDTLAPQAQTASDAGSPQARGEGTSNDSAIVKRIGGVLGLGGLLCGYPYSIEEWGPAVVQQLAERAFDPSPIDATAKKILSEFKRTHSDLWEEQHKGRFNAEQLSSLQDALVTPHSMFA